jgi:putative toxin-antitoxin system antitoxin component (TIGR02293 family)
MIATIEKQHDSIPLSDLPSLDLIHLARKGIPYSMFKKLAEESPFSADEWLELINADPKILSSKKSGRFSAAPSEKIIELALLFEKGMEVFGNSKKFSAWLHSKIPAIGGISPKSLLDTTFGIRLVYNELGRIEHGILA